MLITPFGSRRRGRIELPHPDLAYLIEGMPGGAGVLEIGGAQDLHA